MDRSLGVTRTGTGPDGATGRLWSGRGTAQLPAIGPLDVKSVCMMDLGTCPKFL